MASLRPQPMLKESRVRQLRMSPTKVALGTTAVLVLGALLFVLLAVFLGDPLWAATAVVLAMAIPLGPALVLSRSG